MELEMELEMEKMGRRRRVSCAAGPPFPLMDLPRTVSGQWASVCLSGGAAAAPSRRERHERPTSFGRPSNRLLRQCVCFVASAELWLQLESGAALVQDGNWTQCSEWRFLHSAKFSPNSLGNFVHDCRASAAHSCPASLVFPAPDQTSCPVDCLAVELAFAGAPPVDFERGGEAKSWKKELEKFG